MNQDRTSGLGSTAYSLDVTFHLSHMYSKTKAPLQLSGSCNAGINPKRGGVFAIYLGPSSSRK